MVAGLVLQKSYLNEVWVLLFIAALAAFIIPSLNRRVRLASHRVAFWSAVGALVVGSVIVSCVSIQLYQDLCREGHVIEWLSALMLLMAGLVGVAAMIRLSQQRRPSPMTLFLALGCLTAFCRELSWGEPFVGEKVIYTRFLFRPRAFFDASQFQAFAEDIGLSAQFLHTYFLVFLAVILVVGVPATIYIIRKRDQFVRELRVFIRTPSGRFFLAGIGLYVGSAILAEAFEDLLAAQLASAGLSEALIAEPLELVAAMLLARSMVALWHGQRCYLPLRVVAEIRAHRNVLAAVSTPIADVPQALGGQTAQSLAGDTQALLGEAQSSVTPERE